MNVGQTEESIQAKLPPAILILVSVIEQYKRSGNPEGLGKVLFMLLDCLKGEKHVLPTDAGDGMEFMFGQLCAIAEDGIAKCLKRAQAGRKAAGARYGMKKVPIPAAPANASVRRGGVHALGDGIEVVAAGVSVAESFADRVSRDPISATIEFTKEKDEAQTRGVYAMFRKKLGVRYDEELIASHSEADQGEWDGVHNRGAVFVSRLKKLANWQ